jgi:NADH-quinone oxidoreductase subunit J
MTTADVMAVVHTSMAHTSTPESWLFWVLGPLSLIAALGVVVSRKAVHSALWMALTMLCVAVFFLTQGAVFLGVVQVVVYTGAVMMLFLFVLMLVGVDASDSFVETLRGQRTAALALALGFGLLVITTIGHSTVGSTAPGVSAANDAAGGHVQAVAELLFSRYVYAFEVTSALLITAALGAMVLAFRERVEPRKTQRELAAERIRSGHFTPLPAPGVYARHNAVDTPALLPDGTPSMLSIPEPLRQRGNVRTADLAEIEPGPRDHPADPTQVEEDL